MSHFTVGVIHREDQDIETLLAPYNENIEVEPYVFKTKDELIAEGYRNADHYRYIIKHGDNNDDIVNHWGDDFLDAFSDEEMYWASCKYHGLYNDDLDKDGNWISTYNPKSKWDWYSIGGRWSGELKIPRSKVPEETLEFMEDNQQFWYTDEARIGDIDFGIDEDRYKELYNWWMEHIVNTSDEEWDNIWKKSYYTDNYKNAEDYAKRNSAFSTFAVVTPDGEWHERGEMGWFACSSETPEEGRAWDEGYMDFIKNANPDYIFTMVDCHI